MAASDGISQRDIERQNDTLPGVDEAVVEDADLSLPSAGATRRERREPSGGETKSVETFSRSDRARRPRDDGGASLRKLSGDFRAMAADVRDQAAATDDPDKKEQLLAKADRFEAAADRMRAGAARQGGGGDAAERNDETGSAANSTNGSQDDVADAQDAAGEGDAGVDVEEGDTVEGSDQDSVDANDEDAGADDVMEADAAADVSEGEGDADAEGDMAASGADENGDDTDADENGDDTDADENGDDTDADDVVADDVMEADAAADVSEGEDDDAEGEMAASGAGQDGDDDIAVDTEEADGADATDTDAEDVMVADAAAGVSEDQAAVGELVEVTTEFEDGTTLTVKTSAETGRVEQVILVKDGEEIVAERISVSETGTLRQWEQTKGPNVGLTMDSLSDVLGEPVQVVQLGNGYYFGVVDQQNVVSFEVNGEEMRLGGLKALPPLREVPESIQITEDVVDSFENDTTDDVSVTSVALVGEIEDSETFSVFTRDNEDNAEPVDTVAYEIAFSDGTTATVEIDPDTVPEGTSAEALVTRLGEELAKAPESIRAIWSERNITISDAPNGLAGFRDRDTAGLAISLNALMSDSANLQLVLVHEAAHALDFGDDAMADVSSTPEWLAAMEADGNDVSQYSFSVEQVDEDFAEAFALWFTVRTGQASDEAIAKAEEEFGNRFAFFDSRTEFTSLLPASVQPVDETA